MADNMSKLQRSRLMSRIRSEDTGPERRVRDKLLEWEEPFIEHPVNVSGRPDFLLTRVGAVLFVDGCFWHGHEHCRMPESNSKWWRDKIAANKSRDSLVRSALRARGVAVLQIWECELDEPGLRSLESRIVEAYLRRGLVR